MDSVRTVDNGAEPVIIRHMTDADLPGMRVSTREAIRDLHERRGDRMSGCRGAPALKEDEVVVDRGCYAVVVGGGQ